MNFPTKKVLEIVTEFLDLYCHDCKDGKCVEFPVRQGHGRRRMNIRPVINALDEFCLHCPHVVPVCDRCMVLAFHEWLYAQKEREEKEE